MKKILLLEKEPEIKKEYLSNLIDWWFELLNTSHDFDDGEIFGLIVRSGTIIDKYILEKYKNIKFVFRIWVWLDNIDSNLCKEKWIAVFNSPGANSDSVADLAIWGTLSLMRKIKDISSFDQQNRFEYMWNELWDKNACIIWFGHVGKKIYQRLVWFWVNSFSVVDPFVDRNEIEKYMGCKKHENIDEIWTKIDILYINLPLNKETDWYVDESLLGKLNPDVKIVNIARWWLINPDDLCEFLGTNRSAWAYIDTDVNQQFKKLENLDNCIITPHIGAMTQEADRRMHRLDIKKILDL